MLFRETSRRQVLRKLAAGGMAAFGAVVDPLGLRRRDIARAADGRGSDAGEIYNGLLLLAPGAARPAPEKVPVLAPPILEKIGDGPEPTGITRSLSGAEARALGVPLWKVKGQPVSSIRATFSGSRVFEVATITEVKDGPFASVVITAQPHYIRPYPVPVAGTPERPVFPVKTAATPVPGIYWTALHEIVAIWASDEGLYRMIATMRAPAFQAERFPFELEQA
ncbi:MAG: hypothetical protein KatS3mg062_1135 [Tepidiforma sp.]|jgi:hypothetical protein|nr:hypothetical protein [Tepidiforma sp.]GIW13696.1 MAG: hypothetical protein KatS3mg062_1135 [Tepidiforma sp.]